MEKKLVVLWTASCIIVGILIGIYLNSSNSNLCYYKIPNQLRFNCTQNNESQVINSFQASILEYRNSFSYGCELIGDGSFNEEIDAFDGFHYEINECNLHVPFESFKI